MSLPRVLILGGFLFAHKECEEMFAGVAEVLHDSPTAETRAAFLEGFQPGGKYDKVVGVCKNGAAFFPGSFNREVIGIISRTVRYLAIEASGYDSIDVRACKEYGIILTNTPEVTIPGTATTALFLILSAMRRFSEAERSLRAGAWKRGHNAGAAHDLEGRTIAILGMGGIGRRLAHLVRPFGMRVLYHNRRPSPEAPPECEYVPEERLGELFEQADVVSVHVPLRESTIGFVGERWIRRMKRGAVIVNTARGKVVDEEALMRALNDGHLGGAGLDVYSNEPNIDPRFYDLPNTALLPHLGCTTYDGERNTELRALTNLRELILTGTAPDIVPELR